MHITIVRTVFVGVLQTCIAPFAFALTLNPSAFCQDRGGGDDEWVDEAMATGVTPDF
jgi:hypothetical protein